MILLSNFRDKFVDYLTSGIPVSIASDEVSLFYQQLSESVNDAPNDISALYLKNDDSILLSDNYIDYLRVSFKDDRIIFKTTEFTKHQNMLDAPSAKKMGEAFLGVVFFVESISPSTDSDIIPREYHDKWHN